MRKLLFILFCIFLISCTAKQASNMARKNSFYQSLENNKASAYAKGGVGWHVESQLTVGIAVYEVLRSCDDFNQKHYTKNKCILLDINGRKIEEKEAQEWRQKYEGVDRSSLELEDVSPQDIYVPTGDEMISKQKSVIPDAEYPEETYPDGYPKSKKREGTIIFKD